MGDCRSCHRLGGQLTPPKRPRGTPRTPTSAPRTSPRTDHRKQQHQSLLLHTTPAPGADPIPLWKVNQFVIICSKYRLARSSAAKSWIVRGITFIKCCSVTVCASLTHSDLSYNDSEDEGAGRIAVILGLKCTSLADLNLSFNGIGEEGRGRFAQVLGQLPSLASLALTGNDIRDESAGQCASFTRLIRTSIEHKVLRQRTSFADLEQGGLRGGLRSC